MLPINGNKKAPSNYPHQNGNDASNNSSNPTRATPQHAQPTIFDVAIENALGQSNRPLPLPTEPSAGEKIPTSFLLFAGTTNNNLHDLLRYTAPPSTAPAPHTKSE
jgi:hypothetical protein